MTKEIRMLSRRSFVFLAVALLLANGATAWATPSDSRGRTVTVSPERPYQPGEIVWHSAPPAADSSGPDATCERVPATGYIGQGVFASSGSHFSSGWSWGSSSSGQSFTRYVKLPNDATADWGTSSGGGGSTSLSANTYRWKVQNNGVTPQAWTVCFS
jgi:hypothetical protein